MIRVELQVPPGGERSRKRNLFRRKNENGPSPDSSTIGPVSNATLRKLMKDRVDERMIMDFLGRVDTIFN